MFPSRTLGLLLTFSLLGGAAALADEGDGADAGSEEAKIEKIVEEQVEKENEQDGEAVGADPGEASYNVANCAPAEGEASEEEAGAAKSDPDAIEGCEDMIK